MAKQSRIPQFRQGMKVTDPEFREALSRMREETRRNRIIRADGLGFAQTPEGVVLSRNPQGATGVLPGSIVTAINNTGRDLESFMVAGIEQATRDEGVQESLYDGPGVVLEALDEDKHAQGGIALLFDDIPDGEAGRAYIGSDFALARVRYESEDDVDLKFAAVDFDAAGDDLYVLKASSSGPFFIVDRNDDAGEPASGERFAIVQFPFGAGGNYDDPFDLTYEDEHSEESNPSFYQNEDDPPVDVMFDFRTPPESATGQGMKITMSTGIAYYDDGDETLYGYVADFHYSSDGRLLFIEKERRITIDIPEDC